MNVNNGIMLPNYENSILNLISSILENYDVKPFHPVLKQNLNLSKKQNVILFILDGFGMNLYSKFAEKTFLKDHFVDKLTSVFPPTTSAAISSITSGRAPIEHGAIGWTLFFKEFAKNIDYLPNWDSISTKTQNSNKYNVYDMVGAESIFSILRKKRPELMLYQITESGLQSSFNVNKVAANTTVMSPQNSEDRYDLIYNTIIQHPNLQKFIYSYSSSPDHLEHHHGVFSQEVEEFLNKTFLELKILCEKLKGTSTSILITADHGLIDIDEYFYLNEDEELFQSVILPAFPEPRFLSFFVKKHRMNQFLKAAEKYEDHFWILSREEFLNSKLLGMGIEHAKIDDFVGDYLFIAKSTKALRGIYQQNGKWDKEFKAHHAGITPAEMQVPLLNIEL
ncbi:MAG: alkaline phosphatase family protein [Candidatus Cloacimonetes bacterium]|nr:alkaline phosphatase family protein [Candidatus Cloacimonadota bacterium]MCF7813263.1 alkaline phosphatase family protein [Candidatus Cloacimonadota bacterium]MCF7867338.1 alkaline phosphatase family protein [Candidatus Cloacimonadota bacterium]MCF7882772.1 alkaline phosphatase family protein [Candidatus Cloacimonadota bacterium]